MSELTMLERTRNRTLRNGVHQLELTLLVLKPACELRGHRFEYGIRRYGCTLTIPGYQRTYAQVISDANTRDLGFTTTNVAKREEWFEQIASALIANGWRLHPIPDTWLRYVAH